jgi:tRNA threonylcarbamoyladenosine biosynthesis protein TsaB
VLLLAIETATDVCSVALMSDDTLLQEVALTEPRQHAEMLVPLIDSLLLRNEKEASDVDVIAVSVGPGSYTGLRIGVSTAKGLAFATGAEIVAVPTLEALGLAATSDATDGDVILASFDARRQQVYASAQTVGRGGTTVIVPACACAAEDVADMHPFPNTTIHLVGDGTALIQPHFTEAGFEVRQRADVRPTAASVARMGRKRALEGAFESVANIEPAYLREFVAKMPSRTAFEKLGF